jgi:hypothetical protein
VTPGKGKKSKKDRAVTQFERYVVIADQLKNSQPQPIDRLPAAVADAINAAIYGLFDQYEQRAGLVTDPDNSKSYVNSNVCVWQHIISKAKAQPARKVEAGCKTCTAAVTRLWGGHLGDVPTPRYAGRHRRRVLVLRECAWF